MRKVSYILMYLGLLGIGFLINRYASNKLFEVYLKPLVVKESLDIQESRDRENKLSKYCQNLDYEISVLATSESSRK